MAVAFSSSSEDVLHRLVEQSAAEENCLPDDWETYLEVVRCCEWIKEHGYERVALQFPDNYLKRAADVSAVLMDKTNAEVFILADTSYGSCCVDEVAAEHYKADSIIHFGHSCLSASDRLPVLTVFGKGNVDVEDCAKKFRDTYPDSQAKIAVVTTVECNHCKIDVVERLKSNYDTVIAAELIRKSSTVEDGTNNTNKDKSVFELFGRRFKLESHSKISDYVVLFIGEESMFLTNLILTCRETTFYSYRYTKKICQKETASVNKLLMKRFYLVEKVKDAQVVGILVATLSVTKYIDIVKRLKSLLTHAGKKYYVFSVGKINVAKLANFADVDIYVLVSCPESVILDSSEYYRPIVTPYEVELACDTDREWSGDIVLDYKNLLPGGISYKSVDWTQPVSTVDVSLITGGVRQLGQATIAQSSDSDSQALMTRDPMSLTEVSGELFASRSWQGLDPKLGQTEVAKAIKGRKGIAIQYEEEPP